MSRLKPIRIRYQSPHRPRRAVWIKKVDYIIFPDNTVGIYIYTRGGGIIYLPPIVQEGVKVPLPKYARGLEKIAPEVVITPRGVLYTP